MFASLSRFVPDKGFEGAERSGGASRDGPVAFEKETNFDPFQIDDFLGNLKQKTARGGSSSKQDDSSTKEPSKKKRR